MPSAIRMSALFNILRYMLFFDIPLATCLAYENGNDTPAIKRKSGKIVS